MARSSPEPAQHADVRRHNLSTVLSALAEHGPRSRADLAKSTGLTKATVSKLVNELADRRLVRDTGETQGAHGRPATLVEASDERVVALGLEVDVDHLAVGAVDLRGAVHGARIVSSDNRRADPAVVLRTLGRLTTSLINELHAEGRSPLHAALAVPGLVHEGTVLVAPNLGWREVRPQQVLRRTLGGLASELRVDNEANLAALASHRTDAHGWDSFVYVSAGVGVGAGVVVDGNIFRGAHGFGGEFGHLVVDPGGKRCACGNRGCLETIVGKGRLGGIGDTRRSHDVLAATLATGLAATVSLFDPQGIVLGGYLGPLAPRLAPRIERELGKRVLGARWVPYPVTSSTLGELGPVAGAGFAALRSVIDDPAAVPLS